MGTLLPALMLQRFAQTIEKVIIPNLTDDFACKEARLIVVLLNILAPAMEEKGITKENEAMRGVLKNVVELLRGEKGLSSKADRDRMIEKLDLKLQKVESKQLDISEENHNLRGALVEAIEGLDALREGFPVEPMFSLRQQIRSILRQEIDHDLARVAGFSLEQII